MFSIYDDIHSHYESDFATEEQGRAELKRLSELPWDAEPNQAPCTGWKECGREWQLIEFDDSVTPYRKIREVACVTIEAPDRQAKLQRSIKGN